jgi:hypothetical protein
VTIVGVNNPSWLGRNTVTATGTEPPTGAAAAIHALRAQGDKLRIVS